MKRLLATGVTGFVGGHCLPVLLEAGFNEVHAVSRSGIGPPGPVWHAADLRDRATAARLVERVRPTHLLHAAWIATPGVYVTAPENRDWADAAIALAEAFAAYGGRRFLGIGSSAEYAASDTPYDENRTALVPASLYGEAKLAAWRGIEAIATRSGIEPVWARLFMPYGPGDRPERLIPKALSTLRAGQMLALTDGEERRDFVYAPDAARMLTGLLMSDATGVFNIGSGEARSIRSVAEALADRLGARHLLQFGALPQRPWEPPLVVADMGKLADRGLMFRTPWPQTLEAL